MNNASQWGEEGGGANRNFLQIRHYLLIFDVSQPRSSELEVELLVATDVKLIAVTSISLISVLGMMHDMTPCSCASNLKLDNKKQIKPKLLENLKFFL